MRKRQIQILNAVMTRRETTIPRLIEALHLTVGARTIRNDIKEINEWLGSKGHKALRLSHGGEIRFVESEAKAMVIRKDMSQIDYYQYRLSPEERAVVIALILLHTDSYVTLRRLGERLYVSKGTLLADMNRVRELLERHQVQLEGYPRFGYTLRGRERDKRRALLSLEPSELPVPPKQKRAMERGITAMERQYRFTLTDQAFERLLKYLGVVAQRIQTGHGLTDGADVEWRWVNISASLLRRLAPELELSFDDQEVLALAEQLRGSPRIRNGPQTANGEIAMILGRFLFELSVRLGAEFRRDEILFHQLENWLGGVACVSGGDASAGPDEEAVRGILPQYGAMGEEVSQAAVILQDFMGRGLSHSELLQLLLPIEASLERIHKKWKCRILLVSDGSAGAAQYLADQIQRRCAAEVTGITAVHGVKDALKDQAVDLIVSSVPLQIDRVPTVSLGAMLAPEGIPLIQEQVRRKFHDRAVERERVRLALGLPTLPRTLSTVDRPEQAVRITDLLSRDRIQVGVAAEDWRSALVTGGDLLLRDRIVSPMYNEYMIQTVRKHGPYVVMAPFVAIPYATSRYGALQRGMSLIRLERPVLFRHSRYDPVRIVITMSIPEDKPDLIPFFALLEIVTAPARLSQLLDSGTGAEIYGLLESYEQEDLEHRREGSEVFGRA